MLVSSFWGRQIKIFHSLKFDLGAKASNYGLQINSCSVHLVDIKKEKPFFNSEVRLRAQARTGYNRVSDIIGKADKEKVELGVTGTRQEAGASGSSQPVQVALGRGRKGREPALCCEFSGRGSPGTRKISEDGGL